MFNYANDIDLYHEWASIVMNNHFGATNYARSYFCCFFGRKERFQYAHSHSNIMNCFGHHIVMHAHMPTVFQKVMGLYFYIFRTQTFEEMTQVTHFIQQKK